MGSPRRWPDVTATVHVTYLIRNPYYTPTIHARLSSTNQHQYGVGAARGTGPLQCGSSPKLASSQASNALAHPWPLSFFMATTPQSLLLPLHILLGASLEVIAF